MRRTTLARRLLSGGGNADGGLRLSRLGSANGVSLPKHGRRAELRADRDAAAAGQLGAVRGGTDRVGAQRRSQDDLHLEVAKLAPMQRRRPPPNGIQVNVPGGESRKRSGRKAYGSG